MNKENDPEQVLLTLDQLSQTIEAMTSVVERLRCHLHEELQRDLGDLGEVGELRDLGEVGAADARPPPAPASRSSDKRVLH